MCLYGLNLICFSLVIYAKLTLEKVPSMRILCVDYREVQDKAGVAQG